MLNLSRLLFLLTLLILPPVFAGQAGTAAVLAATLLTGAALIAFLADRLLRKQPVYRVPGSLWLIMLILFLLFQMLPLPRPVLAALSPETAAIWNQAAFLAPDNASWRLALNLPAALVRLVLALVGLGFYWLAVQLLSDRHMLRRAVMIPVIYSGLLAAAGLLGFQSQRHLPLLAMMIPPGLALALNSRPARQFGPAAMRMRSLLADPEAPIFTAICLALLAAALSLAAGFSQSGLAGAGLGAMVLAVFLHRDRRRPYAVGQAARAVLAGAGLLAVILPAAWNRLALSGEQTAALSGRVAGFLQSGLAILGDFSLFGTGPGGFTALAPRYRETLSLPALPTAPDGFLPLLASVGLIGMVPATGFLATIFRRGRARLKTRKDPEAIFLSYGAEAGLAALLGIVVLGGGELTPAVLFYCLFLGALLISASHTRLQDRVIQPPEITFLPPAAPRAAGTMLVPAVFLWSGLLVFSAGQWKGVFPADAYGLVRQGDAARAAGRSSAALAIYRRALALAPVRADTLRKIGWTLLPAEGDTARAEAAFAAALAFAPADAAGYLDYADFLVMTKQTNKALTVIGKGIALAPERAEAFFALLMKNEIPLSRLVGFMPDNARALLRVAAEIQPAQDARLRRQILEKAVTAALAEKPVPAEPFLGLAEAYRRQGLSARAIAVLKKGVSARPADTGLLFALARAYEENLIAYKARRLYKKILNLDPAHEPARQRLTALDR
ncbi:MAG: tetratricopeptide repeat protein [Desulfosudaceae bacterium]